MSERLMTKKTLEYLRIKKAELEAEIKRRGSESSGHQRASLHDDAGAENALNLLRGTLTKIGDLSRINIIEPNQQTDFVNLGNMVKVKFDDGVEEVTILSPDDVIHRKDIGTVVSPISPLGKAIMGKQKDDKATLILSPDEKTTVIVLDIFPAKL